MVVNVIDRKGHDRRYSLDDSLLGGMGYAPRIPFSEGLRATVDWYRDNRWWWQPLKDQQPGNAVPSMAEGPRNAVPSSGEPVASP
jgi:dTDP-D-glucose 4,6-dehydratase